MKNKILTMSVLAMFALVFSSCGNTGKNESATETLAENEIYSCTMHPEVESDKPGQCPKCGMDLVKTEHHHDDAHERSDSTEHSH